MATSTLTSKGQITIPQEIRNHLGLQTGDKIEFIVENDGWLTLLSVNSPTEEIAHYTNIKYILNFLTQIFIN